MGTIVVSHVSKAFKQYPTRWARLLEWLSPGRQSRHQQNWVLQDISFTVRPGEAVGVIGLNGAGKSTLLKMITGTTQPTSGSIRITGRVAALLELGIGFHPDFTGRQNVVMAGQLLGYDLDDIAMLMPSIEAFAEIGAYMDQSVRVYSSGMQMRLAFSVATARRPDVLIVDEALSVGDAYFQHKSFERIRAFQREGTTLLIVSHDKQAIQSICDRAVLLEHGRVAMEGAPEAVMDYYNALLAAHQGQQLRQSQQPQGQVKTVSGTLEATIEAIRLTDVQGEPLAVAFVGQAVKLTLSVAVHADLDSLVLGCGIKDRLGQMMFGTNTYHTHQILHGVKRGEQLEFEVLFDANLGVGSYSVHASLVRNHSHIEKNYHWVDGGLVFEVLNRDKYEFVGSSWNEMTFQISRDAAGTGNARRAKQAGGTPDRPLVVVDVGCRWGFAEKFVGPDRRFQVYGFDPDEQECARLRELYANQAVTLVPIGLAGTAGPRTLHLTQEPACSSLLPPDPALTERYPALACARQVSTLEVATTTLDSWAEQHGVHAADYIKVDTQGTELEILKGGRRLVKTARCLEVEVEFNPIYRGQALFAEVDLYLRSQGFVLWKLSNQVHYSSDGAPALLGAEDAVFYDDAQRVSRPVFGGQLYWANAHYVNQSVLDPQHLPADERARDITLFETLGMPDVVIATRQYLSKGGVE